MLGIVAALITVARGQTSAVGNVFIDTGVCVAALWVLIRALRLIFTIRPGSRRSSVPGSATRSLSVVWTRSWDEAHSAADVAPTLLSGAPAERVLRRPFFMTSAALILGAGAAVIALADPSDVLISRPLARLTSPATSTPPSPSNGRVLLAFDASRSMARPISRADPRQRIDVAAMAAQAAVYRLSSSDELGMWTFSGRGHAVLAPIAPATSSQLAEIAKVVSRVRPRSGPTPLYNTIAAGVRALQSAARADEESSKKVNVLLIATDGADNPPDAVGSAGAATTAGALNRTLAQAGDVQVFVTIFGRCRPLLTVLPAIDSCFSANSPERTFASVRRAIIARLG